METPTLTPPESKLSVLRRMMANGEERDALRLAASFPRLGEEKVVITRAWAAAVNPELYRQMGKDPNELYLAGIAAVRSKYGIT